MKKLLLIAGLTLGALALTGCSDSAEPFVQQSYSVAADKVSQIAIEVRDRQIDVGISEDGQVHIDYFDNNKEFYDIDLSDDKALTMTAKNDKAWQDYVGVKDGESRTIKLQVPKSSLDSLRLSTTNENISLAPISVAEDVALTVNGGNIAFDQLDAGNAIEVAGKNGNISGTIVGGYDDFVISCDTKKGENNLPTEKKGGDKNLSVSSNNGDVNIEFVKD